jgi:hypothetical protein
MVAIATTAIDARAFGVIVYTIEAEHRHQAPLSLHRTASAECQTTDLA